MIYLVSSTLKICILIVNINCNINCILILALKLEFSSTTVIPALTLSSNSLGELLETSHDSPSQDSDLFGLLLGPKELVILKTLQLLLG